MGSEYDYKIKRNFRNVERRSLIDSPFEFESGKDSGDVS